MKKKYSGLTKKTLFEKVKKHLLSMKKPARDSDGICFYRTEDGKKCAIGCLLTKPEAKKLEGSSVDSDKARRLLGRLGISSKLIPLMCGLQRVHDKFDVRDWPDQLNRVAEFHEINTEDHK